MTQKRPNSTTITPNRDIDYVLTYGINSINISTMAPTFPTQSDHLVIILDLDLGSHFSSAYSDLYPQQPRMLTFGSQKSSKTYINYVTEQVANHNLVQRMDHLIQKATSPLSPFSAEDAIKLNKIDSQLTEIKISAERLCSKHVNQCQYWSPDLDPWQKLFPIGNKKQ
jgi:hypothetical protein